MPNAIQNTRPGGGRLRVRALVPWAILIVLMVGVAAVLAPSRASSAEPEIVARVNGEPVGRDELQRMLADPFVRRQIQWELGIEKPDSKELHRVALHKLINRHLVLQEARRRNVTVTREDLSKATTALRGRFKELKDLGAWMKKQGLDDISLQEALRDDLLTARVGAALVEGVRVTEEEVGQYYEAHRGDSTTPEEVRLRIIAVKEKAAAEEILTALQKGEDFERLARERSTRFAAAQGGEMGWFASQALLPSLQEAVELLEAGETSPPLEIGEQVLLIRLEERRSASTKGLVEMRPEIERHLLAAKQRAVVQAWLAEQEKNSKIEVLLSND